MIKWEFTFYIQKIVPVHKDLYIQKSGGLNAGRRNGVNTIHVGPSTSVFEDINRSWPALKQAFIFSDI